MAPIPRRRRLSDPGPGRPAQRRRTGSVSAVPVNRMGKRVRRYRSMVRMAGRSGRSNAAFVSKRMNAKSVSIKGSKRVKVSKNFKNKVRKALDDVGEGFYQKVHYTRVLRPDSDQQKNESLGLFFNPVRYAEAMSVLFGNMTPVEIPTPADITYGPVYSTQLYVKKSWATFEMKNSGQRTMFINIYQCRPKSIDNVNSALSDWSRGLEAMNTNGMNPLAITPNTLHCKPTMSNQFNQYWALETQKVTLGPGQTYKYTMNGPSEFKLDFSKMYHKVGSSQPTLLTNQKFSREVIISYELDLVQTQLGGIGRVVTGTDQFGGLSIEYDEYFVLERPDNTGFTYPATTPAGSLQVINGRRDVKAIRVWTSGVAGTVVDVVEDNPVSVIVDPVD